MKLFLAGLTFAARAILSLRASDPNIKMRSQSAGVVTFLVLLNADSTAGG